MHLLSWNKINALWRNIKINFFQLASVSIGNEKKKKRFEETIPIEDKFEGNYSKKETSAEMIAS